MPDTTSGSAQTRSRELTPTERFQEFIAYIPSGDTIPDETWRGRHRNILILLLAHVPFLLALGLYSGTESLVTGATLRDRHAPRSRRGRGRRRPRRVSEVAWFGRRTRTALATMGLVTTSGFLVHFSGGYIEAHFHFFVVMAVVAVYEDWLPFFLGIGYVSVQHGIFGMIDPSRVYNHSAAINNPWVWAFIHAGFVLMLAAALMAHWSSTERSREAAEQQLEQAREKTQEVENLEEKKAEMERTIAEAEEAKAEAEARQQEVEEFNEHLEATADAYSAAMSRAADGDLTVRIDPDSESDAMAQIAESFNKMMTETESAMAEIQTFSQEVASTSDQATAGANEATGASEDMSESIQHRQRGGRPA